MTRDQIDPFSKQVIECNGHQINSWMSSTESLTTQISESFAWHLSRLPDDKVRRQVILKLGSHLCLECGGEKLPCYCAADQ